MSKYKDPNKAIRNQCRLNYHNYGKARRKWSEHDLKLFLFWNIHNYDGSYAYKDWELAQRLKCTLASIQYLRRKANILSKWPSLLPEQSYLLRIQRSEKTLRSELQSHFLLY